MGGMKEPDATTRETTAKKNLSRARRKQAAVLELIRKTGKDGRSTPGMMKDTPMAREAWTLGEAWRKAQTAP